MSDLKGKISFILAVVAAFCLICAVALFLRQSAAERQSQALLESMRPSAEVVSEEPSVQPDPPESSAVEDPSETAETDAESLEEPSETSEEPAIVLTENPYRESFLANDDMAAWLKIDDTVIDYPVMWTPRDENYYLRRNFEGKSDKAGCLILDTDSCLDPLTTNLIIHGHNMRAGTMFGKLSNYTDPDYCKEHSVLTLYTEECMRSYEVLAVFRSQVYRKTDKVFKFYKFFQADTEEEFDDFYQNIKAMSLYDTGVTAEFGDHFLTLSTCSYHVEQGRLVVVAKEIGIGENYLPFRDQGDTN